MGLLGTTFVTSGNAREEQRRAITKTVPQHLKSCLTSAVTELEVKQALDSIKRDNAPDGFNSAFYHDIGILLGNILLMLFNYSSPVVLCYACYA